MSTTAPVQDSATTKVGESKSPEYKLWDMTLRTLTLFCLVAGSTWGFVKYFEDRKQEYEFTLYKERKEMYDTLCLAAAGILSSTSLADRASAIKTFETLFNAGVRNKAENEVIYAIDAFAAALVELKNDPEEEWQTKDLQPLLGELTAKCMNAIAPERVFGYGNASQTGSGTAEEPPAAPATN